METFVATLHFTVALLLIGLVMVQDTKSGSVGGAFGGGGSNSVLGATGATTLAQQLTRWMGVIFAITCVTLTIMSARSHKSVIDSLGSAAPAAAAPPAPDAAAGATTSPQAPAQPAK